MGYPFFIIFALLCLVLMHRIRYVKRQEQSSSEAFWAREREADSVRKQDISSLPYVYIPLEALPFGADTSPEALPLEETIRRLDSTKILNLNQYSNTDLKLQYGAANLPYLSECDDRFTVLARTLYQWASLLMNHGHVDDAVLVAEYALNIGADQSGIYYMLTDYYKLMGDTDKLNHLFDQAQAITGLNASQIQDYVSNALEE